MSKLMPAGMDSYAARNPTQEVLAIARPVGPETDELGRAISSVSGAQKVEPLAAVGLVMLEASLETCTQIVKEVDCDYVWIVNHRMSESYAGLVRGFDGMLTTTDPPDLINLSLAPPSELLPMPYRPEEPLNVATKALFDSGGLAIFAAGNGGPAENSISPWSVAPWVVSVGAANADGTELSRMSGVGSTLDPVLRPTVVAKGVGVTIPYWHAPDGKKYFDKDEAPVGSTEHESVPLQGTS